MMDGEYYQPPSKRALTRTHPRRTEVLQMITQVKGRFSPLTLRAEPFLYAPRSESACAPWGASCDDGLAGRGRCLQGQGQHNH